MSKIKTKSKEEVVDKKEESTGENNLPVNVESDLLNVDNEVAVVENSVAMVENAIAIEQNSLAINDDSNKTVEESKEEKYKENKKDKKKEKYSDGEEEIYEEMLPNLAKLMNVSIEQLKDEFFLFQIRKFMGKLGKLIVRFNLTEKEIETILYNSHALEVGEVMISPVYLPICGRTVRKQRIDELQVNALVDFPFGENSFKSKISSVKESIREGVDGISVTMPNLLATMENAKVFKKQAKKVGKLYKNKSNVVINATDLTEEEMQRVLKLVGKTKLKGVILAFGEATLEEVKSKFKMVNEIRGVGDNGKKARKNKIGKKEIGVIANVDRADAMAELFKLGVDKIVTPYADEIGEELVARFKIKSVKLH